MRTDVSARVMAAAKRIVEQANAGEQMDEFTLAWADQMVRFNKPSEAEKTAQMLAEQSKGWTPPPDNIRQMSRRRV